MEDRIECYKTGLRWSVRIYRGGKQVGSMDKVRNDSIADAAGLLSRQHGLPVVGVQCVPYVPTPGDIAREVAALQESWDATTERARAVCPPDGWSLPTVNSGDTGRMASSAGRSGA